MRANTQHTLIEDATRWNSSLGYNKSTENIELDAKEKKLFKTKKQKTIQKKKQKYLTRLTQGMGLIQTEIFHTHHAITKLDNMIDREDEEEQEDI